MRKQKIMIMPGDHFSRHLREMAKRFPGRIGLMVSTNHFRPHKLRFPHAIDNGCFSRFDERAFFSLLRRHRGIPGALEPLFVVVPDVWGCHARTAALWTVYAAKIIGMGYKTAFVAQDGCRPQDIPFGADVVFIGGTNDWRNRPGLVESFVETGIPVHVGRVNNADQVRYYESIGVRSVDGTGWARKGISGLGRVEDLLAGPPKQKTLFP